MHLYREGSTLYVAAEQPALILVLSDVHFPYEDALAMGLARQIAEETNPDLVILNGDIWDQYCVSPWPVRPSRRVNFTEEIKQVRSRLARLLSWFPDRPIVYIEGNHELRIQRYLWRKAQELADLEELTVPRLLQLPDRVIYLPHAEDYLPIDQYTAPQVLLGKLYVMHGDTLKGPPYTINVARNVWLKLQKPTLVGHWHVCQVWTQASYDGTLSGAWAAPCLCLPRAPYNAARIMAQGVAVVRLDPSGYFEVELVPFIAARGETVWRGRHLVVDPGGWVVDTDTG